MRQRTTGAPKPEKNKNIFHNICAEKQTALQDQQIYKPASISIVTPTSRSRGCHSGSERAEEKRGGLNSVPSNANPWTVPRTGNKRPPHIEVNWLFR